jgi:LAGLIDADG DNA endonuclease family
MLDGSRGSSKGLYLCTYSFTYDDVKRLSQNLINKSDIKCSRYGMVWSGMVYHKYGKPKPIEFILIETIKFIILPFMHKTMIYKLGV